MVKYATINEVLRLLRITSDYSQKDLADRMKMSASFLSQIENKKKEPSLDTIRKYSEVLNIPVSSILFFEEQANKKGLGKKVRLFIQNLIIKRMQEIEAK